MANHGKAWPTADDYQSAMQNLSLSMSDTELQSGVAAENIMGMPLLYSGGIADVYRVECASTGNTWAVKCFKRPTAGLQERYAKISDCLQEKRLPFMVDFEYLDKGIRIANHWYPILKMQWVEGQTLGEYIQSNLSKPDMLDQLLLLWVKLATWLDRASIAHADLQHGNVMLVPVGDDGTVSLKLVDYDGMWVPALAGSQATELGHSSFQHPQRAREGIFSKDVDRFSHLVICTAISSLRVGGRSLWSDFDNEDNLLFIAEDFEDASQSKLLRELWTLRDPVAHSLVGHLILAMESPLNEVPLVGTLFDDRKVHKLTPDQTRKTEEILLPDSHPSSFDDLAMLPEPLALTPEHIPKVFPSNASATGTSRPKREQEVESQGSKFKINVRAVTSIAGISAAIIGGALVWIALGIWLSQVSWTTGFVNNFGMKFELIPEGSFLMGSPQLENGRRNDETQRTVEISESFYMTTTEVTQEQWERIMGTIPWRRSGNYPKGPNYPAHGMRWVDAYEFCRWLSVIEGKTYTLPSEAQWEYACRAGTSSMYYSGDSSQSLSKYAWFLKDAKESPTEIFKPVGRKKKNGFGLFDMHGNVAEWCADWYGPYETNGSQNDPTGLAFGNERVIRGGSCISRWQHLRSASRDSRSPTTASGLVGFRVVAKDEGNESEKREFLSRSIAEAQELCVPALPDDTIESSVGLQLQRIPAGYFMRGHVPGESYGERVSIDRDFYIGINEVTVGEALKVLGSRSNWRREPRDFPVATSWDLAKDFCDELTKIDRKLGKIKSDWFYTLPSETRWEYAAISGRILSVRPEGDDLAEVAWYETNSNGQRHAVRQKKPNQWGMYDMTGNVSEYIISKDWEHNVPVLRGGSYLSSYAECSPMAREFGSDGGFRVVLNIGPSRFQPETPIIE